MAVVMAVVVLAASIGVGGRVVFGTDDVSVEIPIPPRARSWLQSISPTLRNPFHPAFCRISTRELASPPLTSRQAVGRVPCHHSQRAATIKVSPRRHHLSRDFATSIGNETTPRSQPHPRDLNHRWQTPRAVAASVVAPPSLSSLSAHSCTSPCCRASTTCRQLC